MTIATKNNSIIVKDGAVAENCDCCGGWVCYGIPCPCLYSQPQLPDSLKLNLSVSVPGDLYLSRFVGGFQWGSTTVACLKLNQQAFNTVSGTHTLTRPSVAGSFAGCRYALNHGSTSAGQAQFAVVIGDFRRLAGLVYQEAGMTSSYDATANYCANGFSVRLDVASFPLPAALQTPIQQFGEGCPGLAIGARNAGQLTYGDSQPGEVFVQLAGPDTFTGLTCGAPLFYYGSLIVGDWTDAAGVSYPQCTTNQSQISVIDHTWKCGLRYTDTSGAAPTTITIPSAVTIRVYE